jgi:Lrp/AsnC family transcriptional regulator, leucine-responsive regulatory protein
MPCAKCFLNDAANGSLQQDPCSNQANSIQITFRFDRSGQTMSNEDATPEALDRYHIAILAALQADARLSNAELAQRIGLSAAPTWRRVKWLEDQGYITGYRAEIDRRKLGLGVLAFVRVDAERSAGAATKPLEDAIRQLPEVIACHYISGAGTFELQVMATDLDAFSRFSIDTLLNLPNVKDIHTSFSLGEVKASGVLPLGHLGG